jgi:nocardicin N-oxygenase
MEGYRPTIERIVAKQIQELAESGPPADLVRHFSAVIPGAVICELLGLPAAGAERFRRAAEGMLTVSGRSSEEVSAIRDEMIGYMIELIADRRAQPGQDLLSTLISARDDDDKLSELELIVLCGTLFIAGNQTTTNQISNLVLTLLEHPAELAQLRDHPELLPVAVEELLRFFPKRDGGLQIRIATDDVEIGGVTVRAGEAVLISHTAANRDPAAFDEPDRLDLGRPDNHHVTFGVGAHFCLGAQLARLELQIAIGALLRQFPGLLLAVPAAELPWKDTLTTWALAELMIAW